MHDLSHKKWNIINIYEENSDKGFHIPQHISGNTQRKESTRK